MAVVLWSSSAEQDLENILVYYFDEVSPALAESIYTRIRRQVAQLKTFPNRTRPGRVDGTREYVIERLPFVVVLSIDGDTVHVLSVIHTARKYPPE
jgi:toxin ParE1/3/4